MTFEEYYQRVSTEQELKEFHQFSNTIFINELHYNLSNPDAYSEHSVHFVKKIDNQIVAAYRLILGQEKIDFPGLQHTSFELQNGRKYAEISRWAIHPAYRKKISINRSFLNVALQARKLHVTDLFAKANLSMAALYTRYGKLSGEPFCDPVFGETNKPNSLLFVNTVDDFLALYKNLNAQQ
jgi:hypothetical protein